ncbi:MAG: helix-turn-helix domain-containing protein [Pseudonocardiaceae bacterium]
MELDPEWWDLPELCHAIARHDFKTLFGYLERQGLSQRQLARLLNRSQSEIHDIAKKDRKVQMYATIVDFCERLSIPRGRMGVAFDMDVAAMETGEDPRDDVPENGPGETEREAMERRQFVANAAALMFGSPLFGEVTEFIIPPTRTPPYARAGTSDIDRTRTLTTVCWRLYGVHGGGGCADFIKQELPAAYRLLSAPGMRDKVRLPLFMAVAEAHMVAGWATADTGDFRTARAMFARALKIVKQAYKDQPQTRIYSDHNLEYHGPQGREVQALLAAILIMQANLYGRTGAAQDMLKLVQLAEFVEPHGLTTSRAAIHSAWGHAQLGEKPLASVAVNEITRAQDLYAKHRTDQVLPWWLADYNTSGPVAVTESTYRELATHDAAFLSNAVPASLAVITPDTAPLIVFLNKSRAAELHLKAGDIKNGLQLAGDVATTVEDLWSTSHSIRTAVADLRQVLRFRDSTARDIYQTLSKLH